MGIFSFLHRSRKSSLATVSKDGAVSPSGLVMKPAGISSELVDARVADDGKGLIRDAVRASFASEAVLATHGTGGTAKDITVQKAVQRPEQISICSTIRQTLRTIDMAHAGDPTWDKDVNASLDELSRQYSELPASLPIHYEQEAAQVGYLYRYLPWRAYNVYHLLRERPELKLVMAKPEITVATIGSGPGSDILGILKYVAKHAPNTFVTCHQYDRLDKWYVHWAEIESQIGGRWFQTDFHHFDLLDSSAVPPPSLWPSVDLFTFSYVIAELVTQKEQAKATLAHLFSSAKRGATFLFIDNDRKHYRDFIRELTAPYGISVLMQAPTCMTITFGEDELNELEELERMFAKWRSTNHKPAATWLICQKQ